MPVIKCGGGSSGLSETVLWTNPSPNSSRFNGQTITLSDYVTNYEYIKIEYRHYYDSSYLYNILCSSIFPVGQLIARPGNSNDYVLIFAIGGDMTDKTFALSSAGYYRYFRIPPTEKNKIDFGYTYSGTNQQNYYVIPQKVYGLK